MASQDGVQYECDACGKTQFVQSTEGLLGETRPPSEWIRIYQDSDDRGAKPQLRCPRCWRPFTPGEKTETPADVRFGR